MIEVSHQHPRLRFPVKETLAAVRVVLKRESGKKRSISVVFVNDRFIRRINRKYLKHDAVTDVISFPLEGGMGVDGEVYVSLDRAKQQARDGGIPFREEVRRLVVHGTLHLLGYRDSTKREKRRMTEKEEYFLARLRNR